MTRRSLLRVFGGGWLVLLALRVMANAVGASSLSTIPRIASVVFPVTAVWLAVIAIVLWVDRVAAVRGLALAVVHVTLAIGVVFWEPLVAHAALGNVGIGRSYTTMLVGRLDTNALIYGLVVAADLAIMRLDAYRARQLAASRIEQALTDAQLHSLAIQLQPHFLFNALQFVAETAHDDLAAARRTLEHLRGLVSQAFTMEERVEVTVAEELDFLRAYGAIQRSRFGERFELAIDADPSALEYGIPPLLLQPLVENASRHGFAARSQGGRIHVTIRVRGTDLVIVVADDGAGPRVPVREGQGLSVTRRRLERLHGADAAFTLGRSGNGLTEARIRLPARKPTFVSSLSTLEMKHTPPGESSSAAANLAGPASLFAGLALFWGVLMSLVIAATFIAAAFGPARGAPPLVYLLDEVVGLPFWLAMTLAAVLITRRMRGIPALVAHGVAAVGIVAMHVGLGNTVAGFIVAEPPRPGAYQQWAVWDLLVYAMLVVVARSHDLRVWLQDKVREEIALNGQFLEASRRLARLREMQTVLLASLDDVIASPTLESLDRSVVEFADYLRGEVMPDAIGVAGAVR